MNRTFHHKLNVQAVVTVVLLAAFALWCFLMRTGLSPLFGLLCLLLGAAAVDRMVHTEYVITTDDRLIIKRGRLSKPLVIDIDEIVEIHEVRGMFLVAGHIVIEYGIRHMASVQPADPEGFIKEVKRRLK